MTLLKAHLAISVYFEELPMVVIKFVWMCYLSLGWRMLTSVTRDGLLNWVLYFCHNSSTLPVLQLHMEVMYMLSFLGDNPIPRLFPMPTKSVLGEPGNEATLGDAVY